MELKNKKNVSFKTNPTSINITRRLQGHHCNTSSFVGDFFTTSNFKNIGSQLQIMTYTGPKWLKVKWQENIVKFAIKTKIKYFF
jgi:hypothetical protein